MTTKDKLREKLLSNPKDFTFAELERLLKGMGYTKEEKGKTSGSRIMFCKDGHPPILLHKPHPRRELLSYQIRQLSDYLKSEGLL